LWVGGMKEVSGGGEVVGWGDERGIGWFGRLWVGGMKEVSGGSGGCGLGGMALMDRNGVGYCEVLRSGSGG
jgi:hypothetical protein